jgi:hypothetical protein
MLLIIDLNTNLTIYKSQTGKDLDLVYTQEKINRSLNLTDNFAEVFKSLPIVNEYYLFIGDEAGFMDSRVVYIWLSNNHYFMGNEYFVDRQNFNPALSQELIKSTKIKGYKDLAYSKEPNIGQKK